MTYNVYQDGVKKTETETTTIELTGLAPATSYTMGVSEVVDGNESDPAEIEVVTNGRLTIPTTRDVSHVRCVNADTGVNSDVPVIRTEIEGNNRVIEVPPEYHMNDELAVLTSEDNWTFGSIYAKDQAQTPNVLYSKNDLSNSVWTKPTNKRPEIVKNGVAEGIDSIVQEYAESDTMGYLDIIVQALYSEPTKVFKLLPDRWYTLTFQAKGHTANASFGTNIYPRLVDTTEKFIQNGVELTTNPSADGYADWNLTQEWKTYTLSFKTKSQIADPNYGGSLLFRLNTKNKGSKVEIGNFDISEGQNSNKVPTVAPEDVGIVHGQPQLLDGTSADWKEYTYSGYDSGRVRAIPIAEVGLKVGDKISASCEIENISGTDNAYLKLTFDGVRSSIGTTVAVGATGISTINDTIPAGATTISWFYSAKADGSSQSVIKTRKHILIKGSLDVLDGWKPTQSESGLTVVNGGQVPFTELQYAELISPTDAVRAETGVVSRGAGIRFEFSVIDDLLKRYPTTSAEALKASIQSGVFTWRGKGSGLSSTDNTATNLAQLYFKNVNTDVGWVGLGSNTTASFTEVTGNIPSGDINKLYDNKYICVIGSASNQNPAVGAVSDGITPARVDVQALTLTLTLNLNGETKTETFTGLSSTYTITNEDQKVEIITQ